MSRVIQRNRGKSAWLIFPLPFPPLPVSSLCTSTCVFVEISLFLLNFLPLPFSQVTDVSSTIEVTANHAAEVYLKRSNLYIRDREEEKESEAGTRLFILRVYIMCN